MFVWAVVGKLCMAVALAQSRKDLDWAPSRKDWDPFDQPITKFTPNLKQLAASSENTEVTAL